MCVGDASDVICFFRLFRLQFFSSCWLSLAWSDGGLEMEIVAVVFLFPVYPSRTFLHFSDAPYNSSCCHIHFELLSLSQAPLGGGGRGEGRRKREKANIVSPHIPSSTMPALKKTYVP